MRANEVLRPLGEGSAPFIRPATPSAPGIHWVLSFHEPFLNRQCPAVTTRRLPILVAEQSTSTGTSWPVRPSSTMAPLGSHTELPMSKPLKVLRSSRESDPPRIFVRSPAGSARSSSGVPAARGAEPASPSRGTTTCVLARLRRQMSPVGSTVT
jgi:hypothetical protein